MHSLAGALVLLVMFDSVVSSDSQHASGRQPAATTTAAASSVPGQAFHDWRSALIAARFTSSSADTPTGQAVQDGTAADPQSHQEHLQLNKQDPGQQQQQGSSASEEWVNIVAKREHISTIKGPPIRIANHPAAAQRLRIDQSLIARATADADAAAKTAAAAAAAAGDLPNPPGAEFLNSQQQPAGYLKGRSLGQRQEQQQQQPASQLSEGRNLQQQTRTTSAPNKGTTGNVIVDPITSSSSSSSSSSSDEARLLSQLTVLLRSQPYKPLKTEPAVLASTLTQFVHRGPQGRLYVLNKPWLLKGMDVPNALQLAAGGVVSRNQLLYLLDRAQTLGLNTVRFRAFADGTPGIGSAVDRDWDKAAEANKQQQGSDGLGSHAALQPVPGILNNTMLREGLDWLVHECGLRGLRLLPVLTNGSSAEGGGMKQYIDWIDPALMVVDFYTNDTIKSVFLDYAAALLSHTSSLSGIPLREDPVILGWQLAEEASHPGSPSSQVLLAWLKQLGVFFKERAPHQLLLPGVMDLFGHNSPHHLQHNPHAQVFFPASHSPHSYEGRCHGVDFWLHHQLPEVDVTLAGVFPDTHLACNTSCKIDWTREWIRAHLRDATRMNKPLVLGGIGALRPQKWRLEVLRVVREEIERALQRGNPIGGFILSGLSHPDMPDAPGWSVYYTSKGVHSARLPVSNLNTQAVADVKWRRFMNYDNFLACLVSVSRGTSNDKGEASNTQFWVDGWEDVVHAVAAIGKLPAEARGLRPNS